MKNFFKKVFASCLGVLLFFLLIFLVFFIIGISSNDKVTVKENTILHVKLNGEIKEKAEKADKFKVLFDNSSNPDLGQIVKSIETAKNDSKIKGIYLETLVPMMGYTSAGILRKAISDFKTSGKFVYSYSDFYTPMTYYISSVADSVFLSPNGMIEMTGFANSMPFFKEISDDMGIKWNIFYAGQFKSATEPLRLNKMSDQNRLQLHEFYDGLYKNTSDTILASRDINRDSLESFVNNFKGLFPKNTVDYGLVDSLYYRVDFMQMLKDKTNVKEGKKLRMMNMNKYLTAADKGKKNKSKNKIAVVYMDGSIVNYGKDAGQISPEKFATTFEDIIRKDNIKGVVLRVNSPGGSGSASDEILRAIDKIQDAGKPVIVSMGDYAASGGYYIACHADTIVADPNTLTGSIGVFAVIPEMKELWEDKLKIHFDSVKTHNMGLAFSTEHGMSDSGKKLIQSYIDEFYDRFLTVVSEGRNMTKDQVHEVAQGRIWLGNTALEKGLVDVMGDLDTAIDICVEKANIENYTLTKYPRSKSTFLDQMMTELSKQTSIESKILNTRYAKQIKPILEVMDNEEMIAQPMAKMPFVIEFK